MSIHKSKGLEYPVCFVAGLGKSMNFTESRSRIVVHARYGVAADGVDLEHRVKIHSLSKKVFARKLLSEQMGEEVRRALCGHDPRQGKADSCGHGGGHG